MSKVPENVQDGQAGTMTIPMGTKRKGWEWFKSPECRWCGEPSDLQANSEKLGWFKSGIDAGTVWPNMSDEVVALVTFGTHPECGRIQRDG